MTVEASNELEVAEDYNIAFEEAKEMPIYEFEITHSIEDLKSNKFLEGLEKYDRYIPVVLVFGCIDIEITVIITDSSPHFPNGLDIGYYICVKGDNGEWDSFDYADDDVVITDDLERDMFGILMKYAESRGLFWSKGNW